MPIDIYTPSQKLSVTANGQMNAASPYFPIIADTFEAGGTGDFVVKLDYEAAGYSEPLGLVVKGKSTLTN